MRGVIGDERAVWKGAVAGVLGGLAASWVMNQFQAGLSKASEAIARRNGGDTESRQQSEASPDGEDATMKAAEVISETLFDRRLTRREKETAGPVVHYAFGSAVAGLFGVVAELAPRTATAWGLPFGSAVWLGFDEIGVPLAGFSKSPFEYPMSTHASALAAHLVYGLTTDLVRRGVRAVL